ncbi:MAG: SPOR domain-containing protein [Terracidiphilus sp.]
MRGYFDDEEAEREERGRDTEVTLGWGTLLGIVVCLVLICGLCFGIGYAVGRRASAPAAAAATPPATQIPAPDQEPLQANGSIPKPSADAQAPAPPAETSDATQPVAAGAGTNPVTTPQGAGVAGQPGSPTSSPAGTPASAAPAQPQVRPAFPATAPAPQPAQQAAAPNVHPALPGAAVSFMVQVAAVSHAEDADVLVNALRKRGYTVTERREPADGLIHVRIGPFASREEANRMSAKLLDDGYNAIIQP